MPRQSLPLQRRSGQALSEAEWARHDIPQQAKQLSIPPCHFDRRHPLGRPKRRNLASHFNLYYNSGMPGSKTYYVYIMANQSRTLYVGITNNIRRKVCQHREKLVEGFTNRYKIDTLVYVETFGDALTAIEREKQIKRWRRDKKLQLIAQNNPEWYDLSDGL
jgi:putative endonuclease